MHLPGAGTETTIDSVRGEARLSSDTHNERIMTRASRYLTFATTALLAACASSGQKSASPGNTNVITAEQISHSSGSNAFEVIQRLRPNFLRTRGAVGGAPSSSGNRLEPLDLVVYLNESRLGGSDYLRQIPISQVREIRYFSAAEATTKWGTGHSAGAIQVLSR